jgi:ribosomal-protein-alanine N-acetyltransferase
VIETANLRLIPCELKHFEAILKDQEQLEQMLGVVGFENWFDFPGVASIETMRFLYEHLKANPDTLGWWTYLLINAKDNVLVGTGGYKGKADESGMVEIGYAIVPAYRGRGLATEAAQGFVDHAFSHAHIKRVGAHTLAERNASTRVLEKVGMKRVGTVPDPHHGEIWHWSLSKEGYERLASSSRTTNRS